MLLVHTSTNRNAIQMKKECARTYKHLKKQSAPFANIVPSCSGNQDTTHLREFAIFVSYPGLIENTKSGKLDNLIFVLIQDQIQNRTKSSCL
jgi:hypothetical protein